MPRTSPTQERETAELTPLDEKLAEVLGLAQAAQKLTTDVAKMEGADRFEQHSSGWAKTVETERRTDELVDSLEGVARVC